MRETLERCLGYGLPVWGALVAVQLLGVTFPAEPWRWVVIGCILGAGYELGGRAYR